MDGDGRSRNAGRSDFCEGFDVQNALTLEASTLVYLEVQEHNGVLVLRHCEFDGTHEGVQVCRRECSSSWSRVHSISMSSKKRSQSKGYVPVHWSRAFSSSDPRKRLANGGAHLVLMATPLICWKKELWNRKTLSLMITRRRSLARFLWQFDVESGGVVGKTRWRTISMPAP